MTFNHIAFHLKQSKALHREIVAVSLLLFLLFKKIYILSHSTLTFTLNASR